MCVELNFIATDVWFDVVWKETGQSETFQTNFHCELRFLFKERDNLDAETHTLVG